MPMHISANKIKNINDIRILKEYETQYDTFLECNMSSLLNENTIMEYYLEVRDEIVMRINQIEREREYAKKRNIEW